ncbi:peroxiredoxin [Micromonospora sp. WMMD882]|uniref:peroxiredoxin n=1 Tax=Micromonospora sp. WMMD882 TaxID=3015151 RepID=UPI00248BCB6B|nr:peroxiredoxin [Micromonospora sp. WMMD882]WBB78715.1 peroxiredoxin [Micromonospora sp. WMMD882]
MPIATGVAAPDFTLRDQHNQEVTLSRFRGERAVLLVFYPLSFTGVCHGEFCGMRDNLGAFRNDAAQLLTVSVDSPPAHLAWAQQEGFDFPLLSDFWPHGEVARSYGVFNEAMGIANRGTFVIDLDGIVRFAEMNSPRDPRDQEAWKRALAEVGVPV